MINIDLCITDLDDIEKKEETLLNISERIILILIDPGWYLQQ